VEESDLIPLSALQHYLFCPRQCALIHVEQQWSENRFTAEGRVAHERVNEQRGETRRKVRTVTGMAIRSFALGVTGVADAVELRPEGKGWRPYPVEHKRGRPKAHRADEVQLCAQAMALEEMFGSEIPEGAIFYGEPRRRTVVAMDAELRALTAGIAMETRAMLSAGITPAPVYHARRCDSCSLFDICRPKSLERPRSAAAWLTRMVEAD
jgi:CRISPR-associated exonuclease Cas4